MNKKFLSAILFGALMVSSTGTFVSCKDYDDDIDELWDAVNGQKTDLSGKITAVEATVSNLQSAQADLQTEIAAAKAAADAAQTAADKAAADAKTAALEAQEAAIKAAAEDLAAVKAELQAAIEASGNANQAAAEAALKEATQKIEAEMAEIKGSIVTLEKAYKGADAAILDKLAAAETLLNGKITTLATDVAANATAIGELKTAVKTQEDALAAYKQLNDKAVSDNKSAIDLINAELKNHKDALDKLKAFDAVQTAEDIKANADAIKLIKEDMKKTSKEITKIQNALDVLSSAFYTGVTHVSLVKSLSTDMSVNQKDEEGYDVTWDVPTLDFKSVMIQNSVFGDELTVDKDIKEELKFEGDTQDQMSAKFIIRVSPTNATLDESMISLQNSKGEKLDIVEVKSISPYDEVLTRGVSEGGLWTVEVALKNYDEDTFVAAEKNDNGDILYAVAVDNTDEAEELGKRNIISSYDLTLKHSDFAGSTTLNFFVDDTNVNDINNRYSFDNCKSITGEVEDNVKPATEYKWTSKAYTEAFKADGTVLKDKGVEIATKETGQSPENGDNRSEEAAFPAVQNEEIKISLKEKTDDGKWVPATGIKAMYVTFDKKQNAVESEPSEWNAWNSYKYEGLNVVTEGTEVTIKISPNEDQEIINDYIGFRVYAVNLDGTLVDPDGKAFYVKVGEAGTTIPTAAVKAYAIAGKETATSETFTFPTDAFKNIPNIEKVTNYVWEADGLGNKYSTESEANKNKFLEHNGFVISLLNNTVSKLNVADGDRQNENYTGTVTGTELKAVNKMKATFNAAMRYVLDGTKLNGKLTLKDKDGFVVATLNASIEKALPEAEPANDKFNVKDNQIVNGVYTCYLLPVEGDEYDMAANPFDKKKNTAKAGSMDLSQVFASWSADYTGSTLKQTSTDESQVYAEDGVNGYQITLGTSKQNVQTTQWTEDAKFGKEIYISSAIINNTAKHAALIEYVYAGVSTYVKDGVYYEGVDHNVEAFEPFQIVYSCFMEKPVQTWHWATAADKGAAEKDGKWFTDKNNNGKVDAGETEEVTKPVTSVVYDTDYDANDKEVDFVLSVSDIFGKNTYNDKLYGVAMSELNSKYIRVTGAKIVSNGSQKEDYYEFKGWGENQIKFAKNSNSTNPTADVASTLYVTYIDMYGHETTADVPFTVKKQ